MSFSLVDFKPRHVKMLANYGGQENLVEMSSNDDMKRLHKSGIARTLMHGNRVVACAGIIKFNDFRGVGWGIFQKLNVHDFVAIHRATMKVLEESGLVRIEAYVDPNFNAAMRWVKMLGFEMERPYLPYYFQNGAGASVWVRSATRNA